eukprot:5316338-Ditylum_brightwellii.AAC.1
MSGQEIYQKRKRNNSKIRHKEDISGLNVPYKFKLVIGIKKGKIARRRIGFNLDPELQEGVEEE